MRTDEWCRDVASAAASAASAGQQGGADRVESAAIGLIQMIHGNGAWLNDATLLSSRASPGEPDETIAGILIHAGASIAGEAPVQRGPSVLGALADLPLSWDAMNTWSFFLHTSADWAQASDILAGHLLHRLGDKPIVDPLIFAPNDPVEAVAIWSHLCPYLDTNTFQLDPGKAWRLLSAVQGADGLGYPVRGGGACPDFNFAHCAYDLRVRTGEWEQRLERTLGRFREALESTLRPPPVAEAKRSRLARLRGRYSNYPSVRYWCSLPDMSARRSWWSTLMRLLTARLVDSADRPKARHWHYLLDGQLPPIGRDENQ